MKIIEIIAKIVLLLALCLFVVGTVGLALLVSKWLGITILGIELGVLSYYVIVKIYNYDHR
jgi:LEA14-like dessication related protein